ncbi:UNVERIFIED_CONTAM: hypothetical protein K2H54_019491 [Gekko kuhli]
MVQGPYFNSVFLHVTILIQISPHTPEITDLYSGALFVQVCLGWNLYLSTVLMLAVTAVYTIAGGLAAVIYTDALQTCIMIVGAVVLAVMAFDKIGGYRNLEEAYLNAVPSTVIPNTTCHRPRPDALHLFQDPSSDDLPWTGMTFGLSVLATWYWCTDQMFRLGQFGQRDAQRCPYFFREPLAFLERGQRAPGRSREAARPLDVALGETAGLGLFPGNEAVVWPARGGFFSPCSVPVVSAVSWDFGLLRCGGAGFPTACRELQPRSVAEELWSLWVEQKTSDTK